MLQQTQVSRVIPKYETFLARFPTVQDLAAAERKDVLAAWQGLGYNSRAARLHALARIVTLEHAGKLPDTYEELLRLPGIGPYTAGAILIFAHGRAAPSVDVNVARVVRRAAFGVRERPTADQLAKRALLLLGARPHDVQSALMDLGSAVCTSREPKCASCPLQRACKSKGARPDEKAKPRASAFHGSVRWWRGQIVRHLLSREMGERALLAAIGDDPKAFRAAVDGLVRDGIVARGRGKLVLA
jgi:A/G-specific adenine glycosylase